MTKIERDTNNIITCNKRNFKSSRKSNANKAINMEQYPFLRKNITHAKKGKNTNTKNETDRNYDHFINKYKNDLYHYIIENITKGE